MAENCNVQASSGNFKAEETNTADASTQIPEANPNYRAFKVEVLGQQPNDFDKFLGKKIEALMVDVDSVDHTKLTKALEKAKDKCVKKVCIRPKVTKTHELDNRRTGSGGVRT